MLYSLEYVRERFEVRFGATSKDAKNLQVWQRVKSAMVVRPPLPEVSQFENQDGYICLLDGRRVGFLSEYVRYRFGITWAQYCVLLDMRGDYSGFSPMYLKAYHEKAFEGKSRSDFAIAVEQSLGESFVRSMIDGAEKVFLKRHLSKAHHMTVDEYLKHCGLPPDYPTTAIHYCKINNFPEFNIYARPHFKSGPDKVEPMVL